MPQTPRQQVTKEIIEKFPHTTKLALARQLFKEQPKIFSSVDDARREIRRATGAGGKRELSSKTTDKWVGLQIPKGDQNTYEPFILNGARKVGLLFDIHIPYHDKEALDQAVKHLYDEGIDTLILGGDLIDAYQLSRFEKDPRKRHFKEEIDMTKLFLSELRRMFPAIRIVYLFGNHCERVESYFRQRAPELLGFEALTLAELLELKKFDIEHVKDKRYIKLGKLKVVHGHEFGQQMMAPVNPARGLYMKAKSSTICGHHHQTSNHTENDIEANITGTWSVGCLSDLHPEYRPLNKWNLGFAMVEVEEGGNFIVHNYTIIDGKIS